MATTEHGHAPGGHAPHAGGPINHETTDINLEGFGKLVVGFVVVMGLLIALMYGAMAWLNARAAAGQQAVGSMMEPPPTERPATRDAPNTMTGGRTPAGPPLLTNEPLALQEYRAGHAQRLHSYGWVDRANAVVHLPIARAIELTLERGLPTAEAGAAPVATEEPAEAPADGTTAPVAEPVS
jgi:hypothetical protein